MKRILFAVAILPMTANALITIASTFPPRGYLKQQLSIFEIRLPRLCTNACCAMKEKHNHKVKRPYKKNLKERERRPRISPKIGVARSPLHGNPKGLAIIMMGNPMEKINVLEEMMVGMAKGSAIMMITGNKPNGRGEVGEL